jgi:hypothetical protein
MNANLEDGRGQREISADRRSNVGFLFAAQNMTIFWDYSAKARDIALRTSLANWVRGYRGVWAAFVEHDKAEKTKGLSAQCCVSP